MCWMPTTDNSWAHSPGWLGGSKVKGSVPDKQALDWIATCESYMQHDPEADISRPLCFAVHNGSVCRRLEGHDV